MILEVYAEREGAPVKVGDIDTQPGTGEGFSYAEDWLNLEQPQPISLSLPLGHERYDARATRPYFDGLLPEGSVRSALARSQHVSSSAYIKLLQALGWECIGAVYLKGEGEAPQPQYESLSDTELSAIIQTTFEQSYWLESSTRFSLPGAQPKVSLYQDAQGQWFKPKGDAPSTHIIKPIHPRYESSAANEILCNSLAKACGLKVADIFYLPGETPAVCSRRYDRAFDEDCRSLDGVAVPHRLHQEDFCQALGKVPEHKYEEDAGSVDYNKQIAEAIRQYSSDPLQDLEQFWRMIVFNFIIGNFDAHLKNFGLLRSADWQTLRLAPLYDALSTTIYPHLSRRTTNAIGCKHEESEINREAFLLEASSLGLSQDLATTLIEELACQVLPALKQAEDELSEAGVPGVAGLAQDLTEDARPRIDSIC